MRRIGLVMAVMLAAIGGPAGAQEPTDPATRIAAEIDRYLQNPRSAETYRALANLGDPTFLADGRHDRWSWDSPLLAALDMSYTNCRWRYSDQIYRQRIARLGEKHPYVSHWLKVQRAVFSRCHGYEDRAGDPIPPPLQASDDRTVRLQTEDRAYQQAAALFYEKRQAEARAAFAAIAARPGEHRAAAKLMVASIDAGSEPGFSGDAKPGATAIAKAERLVKDPTAKSMQANAHELVGWIGATADTREARRAQVRVTLEALALPIDTIRSHPQAEARYHRSSEDLLKLFTDFKEQDWWVSGAVPDGYYGSLAMAEAARSNPLVAFALIQRPRPDEPSNGWKVHEAAGEQFAANRSDRDAWRVVLLQLGGNYDRPGTSWAEIDELLTRVAARPTDHDVALLGFLFDYQLRQSLSGSGYYGYDAIEDRQERQVAMTRLAAYPYKRSEHFGRLYSNALNTFILFKDIESARKLRDLVEPQLDEAGYSWLVDSDMLLLLAEDEAAMVKVIADRRAGDSTLLNRLPAQELARLAQDERIDAKVRKRFARVAWTRHFVVGRKIPKGLDAAMRSLNPEIAAKWRSRPGSQPRDHALLLDVLGTPGMNLRIESRTEPDSDPLEIDVYAHSLNNWWCVPDAVEQTGREEDELAHSVDQTPRGTLEALLAKSYLWQSLDPRERDALSAVPKGPELLTNAAIGWAKKASAKGPKGADEALALAVRSTRYGCQMNGGHGAYSKAAWDLLHRKFPDSPAARRTRWWFDCRHFTYGCTDSRKDDQPFGTIEAYEAWEAEEKRQREQPQE